MTVPERVSAAAGFIAIGVGAIVLTGWAIGNDLLKGGAITMKANAAIGLAMCGTALLLTTAAKGRRRRFVADLFAIFVGTLGLLTLSQHIIGWNLGIDELVFQEAPGAVATASPGRMGLNASLSFMLAAGALLMLGRRPRAAQACAGVMAILATIAIVGYWYQAQELYGLARYTGIAWPTASTLLILSVGIMSAEAHGGPVGILMSTGPGGVLARRLLLPAVLLPLALGYVRVLGQQADLYDTGLGTAILVVSLAVFLTALIWRTAVTLDDGDRERQAAQRERDELLVREREARETAERANQLKDEFLATVSHELRTPLNAIVGWTQMLRSSVVSDDRCVYAADVVARNGKFLARLIEDLLDVSRIATGQITLDLQPMNLTTIASRAVDAFAAPANKKGVRLTTRSDGAPAVVSGDPERLQQIVNNLLSNAVKFTPTGGSIDVLVSVNSNAAELVVRDSGRGIRPDFLPHVFERFRQEDATATREHGGLGLGLSIARELVMLHQGSISAFSAGPGQGATFIVSLPLTKTPASLAVVDERFVQSAAVSQDLHPPGVGRVLLDPARKTRS